MLRLIIAAGIILLSLVALEGARSGVTITRSTIGKTPVAHYARPGADGPVVVIAHGFAGSQQMMQGYALLLAQAGYRVFAFDFLGHGRHSLPMSGDVTSEDGTTRLLVEQTTDIIDAVAASDAPVALLGHSMATDILVRIAQRRADVGPVVLISAFSKEIDATSPQTLLHVTGQWEPRLRAFALGSLRMVDALALEGETAENDQVTRRAIVAPLTEHVSVLHSRTARREALAWLDRFYDRKSDVAVLPTGLAIIGLLAGLVISFRPLVSFLPVQVDKVYTLRLSQRATILLVPAVIAPLCAYLPKLDFLNVLVANYLVLHLLVYGVIQLALLRLYRVSLGAFSWAGFALLLAVCAVIAFVIDRYAANFWPTMERFWIIAVMMVGAIPYMVADAVLTANQSFWARIGVRLSFLASLGLAVAIDFEDLFFLLLIAPVLVLFYLVFGTLGRDTAQRQGVLSTGIALGLILAWALGVSFPLFKA